MSSKGTCWEEDRNRPCCILNKLSTGSFCGILFLRRAASIYSIYNTLITFIKIDDCCITVNIFTMNPKKCTTAFKKEKYTLKHKIP